MNEGLAGPRDISKKDGQTVSYGLDEGLLVEFFPQQVHMEFLSKQIGQQIFQERIFTRIVMPGNRLTVVIHQTKGVTYEMAEDPDSGEYHTSWDVLDQCENGDPTEPTKYPNAWARFQRKGISADNGHPVEEWGVITRSYAESLKATNVHTVEALASLSDSMAQNIMGAIKYRDLAKAYLDEAARNRIVAKEQERATKFEELAQVQAKQIEALQHEVLRLQALHQQGSVPAAQENRMLGSQPAIAEGIKKLSRKAAQSKHKIPAASAAA